LRDRRSELGSLKITRTVHLSNTNLITTARQTSHPELLNMSVRTTPPSTRGASKVMERRLERLSRLGSPAGIFTHRRTRATWRNAPWMERREGQPKHHGVGKEREERSKVREGINQRPKSELWVYEEFISLHLFGLELEGYTYHPQNVEITKK
jgi:hypothetical protein